jgi:AraC-like DNA-binding protein
MNHQLIGLRQYLAEATLHCHDYHQVVLPSMGNLELEVAGQGGCVRNGMGVFIPSGKRHAFLARGANRFVVVDLPAGQYGSDELAASFDRKVFFPIRPSVQGLIDYAAARLDTVALSDALMTHWTALLVDGLSESATLPTPRPELAALNRAMAFMRRHAAEAIQVPDVAAAAGVSVTRLHILFRRHCGLGPHAMLMQFRLDAARRLLVETPLSIADIAVRTGHGDQSSLTRRLRSALGMTPSALRRRAREGCVDP